MYEAYYYGNFTGYNIYFKESSNKIFYKKENVKFIRKIKNINIEKYDVYVNDKLVPAIKLDEFEGNMYRVISPTSTTFTKKIKLESNKYKDIYEYYLKLADYAESITTKEEPLYYLARNYKRLTPKTESVLFDYLKGNSRNLKDIGINIVPFDFNQSQYKAIENAMKNTISIIEGPPGTGKTQTILNLIANIISRGENCAVVSNNNTAIDNVYEKLFDEDIAFIVAKLGNKDNVDKFFETNNNDSVNAFILSHAKTSNEIYTKEIKNLSDSMKLIQDIEINNAKLKNELIEISQEKVNFDKHELIKIEINEKLTAKDYLSLSRRLEKPKKINFIEKWFIKFKYRIKLNEMNIYDLILNVENLYYLRRIEELKYKIKENEDKLDKLNKDKTQKHLKDLSKVYLLNCLYDKYEKINHKDFSGQSFKSDFENFLKRYPIVLSTSHSLLNNAPKAFLFDYLIIDEASQGDLLSNILAMSSAKKLVIVGDSRQLQQIDEDRLFEQSRILADKYEIPPTYRYESNSVLKSMRESIENVPMTLLREHYRCSPDIINFCNKMFYDNELIPMTKNNGQHIQIIKTVPGHHARKNPYGPGMYNQREIDEVISLLKGGDKTRVGVITPFRYQADLIKKNIDDCNLEADTVHKFQGRQKDEIILSFVVNSLDKNPEQIENRLYDFVTNDKLLNVAISRGKEKVTAIVSDKVYRSENNVIHDFIKYTEYLYGSTITKESTITSVFDYLYTQYTNALVQQYKQKPKLYKTELLMKELIEKILKSNKIIGYAMHIRLSKIIENISEFSEEERKYLLHPWTHVDFLFYNKVSKENLFVLEVDGIKYHEQNEKQRFHDEIKDKAFRLNNINIYRFKTNESNEAYRLSRILEKYTY